jgi:hypothetical protein
MLNVPIWFRGSKRETGFGEISPQPSPSEGEREDAFHAAVKPGDYIEEPEL